jgi:Subtilisin inhibitor-like
MKADMLRARAGARNLIIAAACAAAVTACGTSAHSAASSGSSSTKGSHSSSSHKTAKNAKISLDIVVTGAGAKPEHWTLTCDPAGGTHPDPAAACAVLLKERASGKDPFGPLPVGVMCPMILANSKSAVVNGTWFGKNVSITLRDGGCDMARWAAVGQIFN